MCKKSFRSNIIAGLLLMSGVSFEGVAMESAPTLPLVGHKPTLELGLRINGLSNLIVRDKDGIIQQLSPLPILKEGDVIEYHGIYSDIDGDIESTSMTSGNTMKLLKICSSGTGADTIGGEFATGRSQTRWSHSTTLTVNEIGCEIVFSKSYPESNKIQASPSGNYTPLPIKGNYTELAMLRLGIVQP
ncbi:hypothetical protein [Citrobacter portucalensis]|uniref:hypothetical protein n=1 Tax=Citrobacter portucalensis TaxID=1639133 RepID=UPI0039FC6543